MSPSPRSGLAFWSGDQDPLRRCSWSGWIDEEVAMADELKLSLVENAEDFLSEAVKYAKAASARDWKYATLHLWTALELLLKAVLENEHWSLLFEDVNKASRKTLAEGDFQTVRFDTALERIRGIVGITVSQR